MRAGRGAERVIRVLWPERYSHRVFVYTALRRHAGACASCLLEAGVKGGGSGRRLEWPELRCLRTPRLWLLADGPGSGHVRAALGRCAPCGVAFNSGVEDAPGRKNADKMAAVVQPQTRKTMEMCHEKQLLR